MALSCQMKLSRGAGELDRLRQIIAPTVPGRPVEQTHRLGAAECGLRPGESLRERGGRRDVARQHLSERLDRERVCCAGKEAFAIRQGLGTLANCGDKACD